MSTVPKTERVVRAERTASQLLENIERVIHGKTERIKLVLAAIACRGPRPASRTCPARQRRCWRARSPLDRRRVPVALIQCTPDLQPTDVRDSRSSISRRASSSSGPVPLFANVLLVDEINRAMPKTQSALLEAMAERR